MSFPEPPELCMEQPEDDEDSNNEEVPRNYFNLADIENHNCPPNTTPLGPNCISLCKKDHQQELEESEAAIFEVYHHLIKDNLT
ncbi:hypothetical protein NQ314_015238 [Rhamnusium bicolor]|uniref:Uncharacterized protein n=1 Tax=Rhamnusium bicolor TaxID=1586634 RepID=A0AAV8X1N2_9CUCU|nr:hypothetical protein NQ314_015238 [Rhamnusium bicolor]